MITFYLVRHGNKAHVPFDPPLTEMGLKQAEITAKRLSRIKFKEILASPKRRTYQTAEIIAKPHRTQVKQDGRLIERLEWENDVTFDDFLAEWNKTDLDRAYQPMTGSSSTANGKKMRQILEELEDRHNEGNILLVTHGGTIGDTLRNLFSNETIKHKEDPTYGAKYIEILECSITQIEKGKSYKLLKLGDISHLSVQLV